MKTKKMQRAKKKTTTKKHKDIESKLVLSLVYRLRLCYFERWH